MTLKKTLKKTLFKHLEAKISLKKREKQMMITPQIFRVNKLLKVFHLTKDLAFSNSSKNKNLAVVLLKNRYLNLFQLVLQGNWIKKLQILQLKIRRDLNFKSLFQKKISLNHRFNQIQLLMKLQL